MGMTHSFFSGWYTALSIPAVLIMKWAANFFFAIASTLALGFYLYNHFGHSALTRDLADGITVDTLVEFLSAYEGDLKIVAIAALPPILIFVLVHLFLTGGILQVAYVRRRLTWGEFFSACGRRFIPLNVVAVLSLILFALLVIAPYKGMESLHEMLTKNATTSTLSFYYTWMWCVVVFLLLTWVARVNDYARVFLLLDNTANPFHSFVRAMGFTLSNIFQSFVLWIALLLPAIGFTLCYGLSVYKGDQHFGEGSIQSLLIVFLAGQLLIFLRGATGVARLAGQMRFAEGRLSHEPGYEVIPHPDHENGKNG